MRKEWIEYIMFSELDQILNRKSYRWFTGPINGQSARHKYVIYILLKLKLK